MVKWVSPDEPNNIPSFPYTNIGVGALVVDKENNVLVVQEKFTPVARTWKYPGGFATQGNLQSNSKLIHHLIIIFFPLQVKNLLKQLNVNVLKKLV